MEEKFQNINLLEIGSIVPVDLAQIKDKLSPELSEVLKNDPLVTVTDYKMTDATGIGVVVKLKNGKTTWFFQHEIIAPTIAEDTKKHFENRDLNKNFYQEAKGESLLENLNLTHVPINKNVSYLINPISFIKWIIYSSKDVF